MKYTLNEKKYMRFQNIFLCVFLCGFLLSGFHNGTWQEVLAAAVPEGKITRETKTMPEETIMKEEPEDSGEDISGVFQLTAGETEITVYTYGEEMYGFYGKARMTKETKGSAQNIEIMGHKEGFYDGVEIYS